MPIAFSRKDGARAPHLTLYVFDYIERQDKGTLTPATASFGFKTYFKGLPPRFTNEETYICNFKKYFSSAFEAVSKLKRVKMLSSGHSRQDSKAARKEAHDKVLGALRPPQFAQKWVLYHSGSDYNSLSVLHEEIKDVKEFWETWNNMPVESLARGHSLSLFKKGIKPTWEDRKNQNGGCWTFRVSKDKSSEFWKEVLLMLVGEQFAPVLEPGDDLCGVSFNSRFNINHISVWNRSGSDKVSADKILKVILDNLSDNLKPANPDLYFYKKHSDRPGFAEAVGEAGGKKAEEKK
ncbi:MAG: hypothetical protein M1834_000501 [Cirrosporium novae-zelandiae]|nr:MAG: hypothetical protein M1834_000501 [Cirrosporium novae-zelandiae]